MLSRENYEFFKTANLKKTSMQLLMHWLLFLKNSDNVMTGHKQLSYHQFNRNLSPCVL